MQVRANLFNDELSQISSNSDEKLKGPLILSIRKSYCPEQAVFS